jgi:uncharacterized membrane protein
MAQFTEEEQQLVRKAVELAEKATSGEIRVCIEKACAADPLDRAAGYFRKLGMDRTKLRNGVLIYLATDDRKFAIIGDAGINQIVPADFWDKTRECMLLFFKEGKLAEGIATGIRLAGEQLKTFFPYNQESDKNELSDEIAFMDETPPDR